MVIYGFEIVTWLRSQMVPATRKTTARDPLRVRQSRKLFRPLSLKLVTSQTKPPRPPTEAAPPPCAPGKAGGLVCAVTVHDVNDKATSSPIVLYIVAKRRSGHLGSARWPRLSRKKFPLLG